MEGPWRRGEASASGQVFEDRIWALLMEQSRGHLHVFRPLLDRGVDGLLHRLSDGAYIPVQAKGRSSLRRGRIQLLVVAESMRDDHVVVVAGEIFDGGLGPTLLVIPTPDFRRLALLTSANGTPEYSMSFSVKPGSKGRWVPWLVPADRLAEKFGVPAGRPAPTTYFTVVAWTPDERRFHAECLVIPSEELLQIARPAGSHYKFEFNPGSKSQPRLDKYRRALADLSTEVDQIARNSSAAASS